MDVAVCVAGQMRGFRTAAPTVVKHLVEPLQADVFVHTWSDVGTSNNAHNRGLPTPMRNYLEQSHNTDLDSFRRDFPATAEALVPAASAVTTADLESAYGPCVSVIEDYPTDETAFFGIAPPPGLLAIQAKAKWSLPLFYKVAACNDLKRTAEAERGRPYDLVIRIRPDLTIDGSLLDGRAVLPDVLWHRIRTQKVSHQVADQLFFGSSATLDAAAALYGHIGELWAENSDWSRREIVDRYWAEGLLKTWLTEHTAVEPKAFRTEPFGAKTVYDLVEVEQPKLPFAAFFEGMRADLPRATPWKAAIVGPGVGRALFQHARALSAGEDLDAATRMVEAAERESLFDTALVRALLAFKAGDVKAAEAGFRAVVAAEPEAALPLVWLGRCLVRRKRAAEALEVLDRAVAAPYEYGSSKPQQKASAFYWRGRAHDLAKHREAAEADWSTALALGLDSVDLLADLGRVSLELGRPHRAAPLLAQALSRQPTRSRAALHLALAYEGAGVASPILSGLWPEGNEDLIKREPPAVVPLVRAALATGDRRTARRLALLADPARLGPAEVRQLAELATRALRPDDAESLRRITEAAEEAPPPASAAPRQEPAAPPRLSRALSRLRGKR